MPKTKNLNIANKRWNEIYFQKEKNAKHEKLFNKKESLKSETDYPKIFKNAPIPVAVINKNGKTAYLNPFFIQTFGYTLKDIPDAETWFLKAYPDNYYRDKILTSWKKLLSSKKNISNEKRTFYV
ncbi:MAG: PAS domain S-box protein, partial [Melioribacteraceae bacterium]